VITIGRSKEFDKVDVLHKAMLVFWEKGYETTSIPDLLEAMKISRSSLYETFVDKETLYVEALRHYKKTRFSGKDSRREKSTPTKTLKLCPTYC